jgi:hypothetical protein
MAGREPAITFAGEKRDHANQSDVIERTPVCREFRSGNKSFARTIVSALLRPEGYLHRENDLCRATTTIATMLSAVATPANG